MTQAVSMAPVPVDEMGKVMLLLVWKTSRSISQTSSITWKKAGSRCPITGLAIACSTRGWTVLGPGPSSTFWGGCNSLV